MEQKILDHLKFTYEKTKWPYFDYSLIYGICHDVPNSQIKIAINNLVEQGTIKLLPGIHETLIEYLPNNNNK